MRAGTETFLYDDAVAEQVDAWKGSGHERLPCEVQILTRILTGKPHSTNGADPGLLNGALVWEYPYFFVPEGAYGEGKMKKNTILRAITYLSGIVFMLSVACLDTEGLWPFIGCVLSAAWILLFTYANTIHEGRKKK